jgi:LuxR family transcriptional regulator, maltose regulon positive regulatory protein
VLAPPPDAGGRDCPPLLTLQRCRTVAQVLTAAVSPYDSPSLPGAPATDSGPLPLKIRQTPLRHGLVPRERLVQRLLEARDVAVAFILAPAGYGKTTVLSQWSQRDERPFAWVNLDAEDNDPKNLVTAIALALEAIEPVGWEVFEALTSERPDATDVAVQRLVRGLGRRETPVVLALDNVHVLRSRESRDVVTAISQAFGAGLQLALASRGDRVLPIGRLRAHGSCVELRTDDLTMTRAEASMLLSLAGVELAPEEALRLTRRTEGWPAGLYLAALSLRAQETERPDVDRFAGDDRFVAEYVRDELLSHLPADQLRFLTQTSVLDLLSGPICDAILERRDSADMLTRLAQANVMLTPLDRCNSTYRYHELYATALQAELRRLDPGRDADVHRRASRCWAERGDMERAIAHAIDGRDVRQAGRLLWDGAAQHVTSGRQPVIRGWLSRFADAELAADPLLALAAAATALLAGDLYEAERWTTLAGDTSDDSDLVRAGTALMEAAIGHRSPAEMVANAARAHELLGDSSPWIPLCRLVEGVGLHLGGERDAATARLQDGAHRAAVAAPMVQALCLAQLALVASDRGDLDRSVTLAERAAAQVRRCGLERLPTVALALAVSAEGRARRGEVAQAAAELRESLALLERITDPSPWYEAECRLVLARARLRLNGPAAARELSDGARRTLERIPDAPVLRAWLDELAAEIDLALSDNADADWSLTPAELRVLRFLPSHLSFREIAEQLFVSPNTVKTHVRGIYRKLDVSSRGSAVERARRAGLVEPGMGA